MAETLPLDLDAGPLGRDTCALVRDPERPLDATRGPLLTCTVYGKAEPAGSKRAFAVRRNGIPTGRVAVVDDNPKGRGWKQECANVALAAMDGRKPFTGPLVMSIVFHVKRPAGHFGSGANAGKVRASAPPYPDVRPDCTKLVRAVEDALTGIVWLDDAQIIHQTTGKRYGLPERTEISVSWPLIP